MDTALKCLVLTAHYRHVYLTVENLKRRYAIQNDEISEDFLVELAVTSNLKAKKIFVKNKDIKSVHKCFPVIARLSNHKSVVVINVRPDNRGNEIVSVLDPLVEEATLIAVPIERFQEKWSGGLVLVDREKKDSEGNLQFGFAWFWREMTSAWSDISQIVSFAFMMHILNFVAPLFSMVVLDKVLSNNAIDTLHVLFVGALLAIAIHSLIGYLRSMALLHITGRIDIKASELAFDRLLALPLEYFQSTAAGVTARNMQQISGIRDFLTGQLLLTLLEASALVILLPILWLFNEKMTLIVIAFTLLIALNVVVALPFNRHRLTALYKTTAAKDSLLIETVTGIETVKGMALEPAQKREWMQRSAESVRNQFQVGRLASATSEISNLLNRAMTIVIVWVGIQDVLSGAMTAGAMIAFNMLSARITGPLVQMVGLVSKYQQVALSMKMLAGVVNRGVETARAGGITPEIRGAITFENVAFSYPGSERNILDRVQFSIKSCETVGVVGRSGAGKSTIAKLIQGFYRPKDGFIRVDGYDMKEFDLTHLRTSLGVVPQQSFFFRGTIMENVTRSFPSASLQEVIQAARLSGADKFIEELPQGYETLLEENASNLSGGQRQRLAVARALLPRPRILILDEATSALDPDSETTLMERFPQIAAARTVINISHRLNTLVTMNRILVLDNGRVIDFAPHRQLLERCDLYRTLWFRQNPHAALGQAVGGAD